MSHLIALNSRTLPLTTAQQEIWQEQALTAGTAIHTVSAHSTLSGPLDSALLEVAIAKIWEQHEALRLTPLSAADAVQVQAQRPARFLSLHDVSAHPEARSAARALAEQLGHRIIPLDGGPTFRFDLIRYQPERHIWVMSYHHINMDAWANGILMRDVAAAYATLSRGQPLVLEPTPSYTDAVVADQAFQGSRQFLKNQAYWTSLYQTLPDRLVQGVPAVFQGRPPAATTLCRMTLDVPMVQRLRTLAQTKGTTPARLFMAAALILFHREVGALDMAFGMPVLNRSGVRDKATFGLFSLTTAPRVRIDPAAGIDDLLARLDSAVRGAMRHHRYPLSGVNRALGLAAKGVMQLFDLNISYERVGFGELDFGDATASVPQVLLNGVERVPVELFVREYGNDQQTSAQASTRIEVDLEFSLSAFSDTEARALATRYQRILQWLADEAVGQVAAVPLVSPAERTWLLDGVNATAQDFGPFVSVHQCFEAVAAAHPERVALRFEGAQLSYGELNTRAEALAQRLLRAGVGPDVRVGVTLERSLELVVALLAVLKAGGAYVPLDPALPTSRLAYMLEDAAPAVVITRTEWLALLPAHGGRTLCLNETERGSRRGVTLAAPIPSPEDLAYVIYTSGSTGQPKGVMNSHGALHNRLAWMQARFALDATDRVLQKTPYTFDVSVWEFFWPLMSGACLVIAKPDGHRDPAYLAAVLRDEAITLLHFVPSMLQTFLSQPFLGQPFLNQPELGQALGALPQLRHVLCSGEALSPALAARFRQLAPPTVTLHNLYGPTEAAIDVSHWACDAPTDPLPIGHAIANTRLYVLDSTLEPVPVGVTGELWIGGVQLARGYLQRPALTAQCFIADPFAALPGARMYRTGDNARRRPDGALEYLGRQDSQVKLNGQRIELGEIEAVLLGHAQISEAAVALRTDEGVEARLVGYLVSATGALPTDLTTYLTAHLPAHMVPAQWRVLGALPLGSSGKLDRKALPAPELADEGGTDVQPRSPEEEVCCAVFASVLRRERVGVTENFFALGGHSLLAIQVLMRLRRALAVELPANVVFSHPTPRALASYIQTTRQQALPPLTQRDPTLPRRATAAETRLWLLQQRDPQDVAYNMLGCFDIEGALDSAAMSRALGAVQARHPLLHSLFCEQPEGLQVIPRPDLVVCPSVEPIQILEQATAVEASESLRPFRLDREPGFRARILRLSATHHRVLIGFHHLIADAESIALFGRDLETAYGLAKQHPMLAAMELGERLEAPGVDPLAAEERLDFTSAGAAQAGLKRWLARLDGVKGGMPLARHTSTDPSADVGVEKLYIDNDFRQRLSTRARGAGVTPFVLLHTALAVLLYRYSGEQSVLIGTPVSQRGDEAFQRSMGMLLNTVPLPLTLNPASSIDETIEAAAQCMMAALGDSAIPLDRILDAMNHTDSSQGDGGALIQVLLTTHAPHRQALSFADAEANFRVLPQRRSKMDLVVLCADDGQQIEITIEHAAGLFGPGGGHNFALTFESVLETVVEHPHTRLDRIALSSGTLAERLAAGSLAQAVNSRPAPLGGIAARFDAMVAAYGEHCAVEEPDGTVLSYAELNRRSIRLAEALAAQGIGRGARVGVCMARGAAQITAFLGILKAGGAYVPLDPELPTGRLAAMALDAEVGLVLIDGPPPQWLPPGAEALDIELALASDIPRQALSGVTGGTDAAYVMYTSGSTGIPKGVMVPQRAVLRLALEAGFAEFGPGKRVAQFATTAFDAATYEIWCPLLNGASCVIIPRQASYDAEALAAAFQQASVHSTFLTVSVFNRAVFAQADAFAGFQEVLFGGEAADAGVVREALRRWPQVRFINGYGPTETTTFAACHNVQTLAADAIRVPIGRPIRATALYVLDAYLQPLPQGVVGELYIGGAGLADGYLNRPGQTAQAFVADPFSAEAGARMYHSGDLARWRAGGTLEYLGRADRQLKLRGYRIEPGEVEAVLREVAAAAQMPVEVCVDVRESVLGTQTDQTEETDRALYAWVVPGAGAPPPDAETLQSWRAQLAQRLPAWMVPRRIVLLEALPLTANGKLDIAALPLPAGEENNGMPRNIVYTNETQRRLAALWAQLLGGGPYGPEEGFFQVGGHSLLGVRLVALIRDHFVCSLPLRVVFAEPSLQAMAGAIDILRRSFATTDSPSIETKIPVGHWQDGVRPVSAAQARLALMDQIDGSGRAYTVPVVSLFDGVLDPTALTSALRVLVERHEPLRTVIQINAADIDQPGDLPAQVEGIALPSDAIPLHIEEHPAMAGLALHQRIKAETRRLAGVHFDLARDVPLRAHLLLFGEQCSALVLIAHHSAVDGHSIPILISDLGALYSIAIHNSSADLADLPIRYSDWVVWRQSAAWQERDKHSLALAREALAGAPDQLLLPTDFPRPRQRSHAGEVEVFVIDSKLEHGLRAVAKALSTTPFVIMTSAYALLLARTANTNDLILGVPFADREAPGIQNLVGYFAGTTVVRVTLDDNPTGIELVARVHQDLARALAEPAALEDLINVLDLSRDTASTPLFQAMIAMSEEVQPRVAFGDLVADPLLVHPGTAKFDLQLQIVAQQRDGHPDHGQELVCALEYATDLFSADTARALATRYQRILQWLADGAVGQVAAVPLVSPEERAWLLDGVNATAQDFGPFVPVPQCFEAVAAAHPERVALRFEGTQLSYGELNTRADALAQRLLRAGVGPDVRVGVTLERSLELVVALLAVLKAGGAYVPLDPTLPTSRLAYMLEDAAPAVVITRTEWLALLPAHGGRTLCLNETERGSRRGVTLAAPRSGPEDLAYVIYTSGSTGQPKGVMNSHGALRNRLAWMQARFALGAADRVLQKTPYTFDVSVWEFFWPLMSGACLVIAKPDGHRDPAYLAAVLRDEAITLLHFVPSMLQTFLGQPELGQALGALPQLRHVLCSGEALSPTLAARFRQLARDTVTLHNLYGPTEAAIDVSHWACGEATDPLPIGHAIANTRLYVLDSTLEPVPVGVSGELWIGGVQLARGYLQRPALTAQHFIADPFTAVLGARMYRTGDNARRRPDGALEYLGRQDSQVKLNGQRIELGEIEAVLLGHEQISEAAVALRTDEGVEARLVGYLVSATGALPTDLTTYLSAQLPAHMIPAQWVVLSALPLGSSGKLDRKALPAPELADEGGTDVQPRSPEEEVCCAVFASVLRRERVGVEENFFALGGHSLLAIQVLMRLRRALAVELPANVVFSHPTPRALAGYIQTTRQQALPPLTQRDPGEAVRPSVGQEQLWFLARMEGSNGYNVPDAFIIQGPLNLQALSAALSDVVARHEPLRACLPEVNGQATVTIMPPCSVPVPLEQLTAMDEATILAWFRHHALYNFDLMGEMPLRVNVGLLPDGRHLLSLVTHHSATDGGSAPIFYRDLSQAYHARCQGRALSLPPLSVSYFDWALWQREQLESAQTQAALNTVVQRFADLPEALDLPQDFQRRNAADFSGAMLHLPLTGSLAQGLREKARSHEATLFMVLLAGLGLTLQRLSGQSDMVIGTPASGRDRAEIQDLVGYFINVVPLRLRLDEAVSLSEVIEMVRHEVLAGFDCQDLPLDRVVHALRPALGNNQAQLFRTMLVLQPAGRMALELDGAKAIPVQVDAVSARYDLTFAFEDYATAGGEDQGLGLVLHYAADLFSEKTARRFAKYYTNVLQAIISPSEPDLAKLSLLTNGNDSHADPMQLIATGSLQQAVDSRPAPPGSIAARFDAMVTAYGEHCAVEEPDGTVLSYAELNRRSIRLAEALAARGIGRGTRVGVCTARGAAQITAFLGILKAGGAYVPLEPELPTGRLAAMALDAEVGLVLIDGPPPQWLPPGVEALGVERALAAETPRQAVSAQTAGADAAYVIYTSGSTGTPKGMVAPQRAVLRLALEGGFAEFGPGKRVAQLATTAFDAATYEIWCPLLNGASCVIIPRQASYDAEALAQAFQQAQVHSIFLTVAVFNRAVFAQADAFGTAQEVLFGGEATDAEVVREALRRWPQVRFINVYGPTETTTFATYHNAQALTVDATRVPIGRPIRATALYVLDAYLQPLPQGVVGELYIGGAGLADGYLNRPGQTAQAFVADPFSAEAGARMYRSGDLVRWRTDGTLEYLSRVDRQLKLRGYRIEPGEVEAVLREVAAAAQMPVEVCVEVRETPTGDPTEPTDRALYAWVVAGVGTTPPDAETLQAWRAQLAQRLPVWMVPRRLTLLEALPLTASGKLDRAALSLPIGEEDVNSESPQAFVYASETQQRLAALWAQLLGGGPYGPEEGFFQVGGHSLLGVRLVALIREHFACSLPLRVVFDHSRLQTMASAIDALVGEHGNETSAASSGIQRRARRSKNEGSQQL